MSKKSKMAEIVVENFINGAFVHCANFIESEDPSTGETWAKIPDSCKGEVNEAVRAAKEAFCRWSVTPVGERSKIMEKIADILESRLEEFAVAESRDQGKPVALARAVDIPRAVYNFRFYASAVKHDLNDSTFQEQFNTLNYMQKMPGGVAGLISPWNLPLYLLTFKIAPAIASGCTIVCKPSEMTSVTAWMLCSVLNEAGLPPGVVNMVFGYGHKVGQAITSHPDVPLVSFTGSTATAVKIQQAAAPFYKKLSLELGGKNPAIIFDDANLTQCISTTVRSSFANQGEICLCTSRIYVQRTIYENFCEQFVQAVRKLKVGDPKEDVNMGALISLDHKKKVISFIDAARDENATILCGYGVDEMNIPDRCKNGHFVPPTVITNVADTSKLMQEEIFGPVVCVVPFNSEEEVIVRANMVQYGLCASVWTSDLGKAHRVSQKLEVGTAWVNCWLVRDLNMPFGGTKASGIGRESAKDSLDFYTEKKTICVNICC